jgi:hypothetical protein
MRTNNSNIFFLFIGMCFGGILMFIYLEKYEDNVTSSAVDILSVHQSTLTSTHPISSSSSDQQQQQQQQQHRHHDNPPITSSLPTNNNKTTANHPLKSKLFGLAVRTFSKQKHIASKRFIPTLVAFVSMDHFSVTFILDDTPEDHAWGETLQAQYGFKTEYEIKPENWTRLWQVDHYGINTPHWGYIRQQWGYLWLDSWVTEQYIGWIDIDACFNTILTTNEIFNTTNGKIILRAISTAAITANNFPRDFILAGETFDLQAMSSECFPMWFHRDTFKNFRRHVINKLPNRRSDNATFADAWLNAIESRSTNSRRVFNPPNLISWYAMTYESYRYEIYSDKQVIGTLTPQSVLCPGSHEGASACRNIDPEIACYQAFGISSQDLNSTLSINNIIDDNGSSSTSPTTPTNHVLSNMLRNGGDEFHLSHWVLRWNFAQAKNRANFFQQLTQKQDPHWVQQILLFNSLRKHHYQNIVKEFINSLSIESKERMKHGCEILCSSEYKKFRNSILDKYMLLEELRIKEYP